ncbi:fumarylacetoacetase [Moesziomyces antarcticus]|uniref:Fumarylacetoacetase n=1 Tax=Pseudozyma antarctica TaxID=84753 RepID=A0A081CDX5_PSEA2|nr:fumarylacetoacetase [Moesziomyces antarcticus]GAK64871.1 fumarylacetoacetase [Moesziomyces antarcticus]
MKCVVEYPKDHPFPIQNLPYGSFYTAGDASSQRCGVAIGDYILDLQALSYTSHFSPTLDRDVFAVQPSLNAFMGLEKQTWLDFRTHLQQLLSQPSPLTLDATVAAADVEAGIAQRKHIGRRLFVDRLAQDTVLCLPCRIGDYTDFYSSLEHAYNCGVLIRGKENALQPNWRHLPVAYHGRASSIVPSGTPIHRPVGQILDKPGDTQPVIAPCRRLDFELEVGFRLSPAEAADRVFGAVLLNDWSARDIQTWEYVPLGPFLSKNFATTISPWIVPVHALEQFTCPGYDHQPPLLPYLQDGTNTNFDIPLTVALRPWESDEALDSGFAVISHSSLRHTYYTVRQMIAHHSTTGCPLNPGDLLGTGTLSAPGTEGYGSLLEMSHMGRRPFSVQSTVGEVQRTFLNDGDTVKMSGKATASNGEYAIGFGECVGTILPAVPM